jgi:endo-1,4-beta-D-glucanase Y
VGGAETEDQTGGAGGAQTSTGESGVGETGAGETDANETGANYPFPQNFASDNCVYPSNYDNADVRAAYDLWKETVVTSDGAGDNLRVRKPDSGSVIDSTVSEGMGYGMLLAVYMDDQTVFDGLWKYAKSYFNGNGLMDWEVDPNGAVIGTGAALDGDEDMAWALVMADRQWGGSGSLDDTYLNYAIALIEAMWEHEIDHGRGEMPLPGDSWGGADITNISYYAPAYYRVFGQVTGNVAGWNAAIDRSYEILNLSLKAELGNAENGLVPAWCDSNGVPTEAYGGAPLHFQNDSTRTPFRVGQDYCYYGEPRARDYMEKITSFYTTVGVGNIVDGYELDGTPRPDFSQNGGQPASFVGPAAVGAMYSADNQAFIDEAYAAVATGELTAGTIYYQKSWSALSLLMLTGNFVEFPAP